MTTLTDCMRGNRRRGREEWPTVSVESEWSDACTFLCHGVTLAHMSQLSQI
jgi:hypothetical protein